MVETNFKHTEIGLIPHDWEVKTLDEYAYIFNGDRSDRYPKDSEISRIGIPFVNAGHIVNGRLDFSNMDYISIEKYNSMSGVKFMVNDLLVCLRGSLGKNAKIDFEGGTVASSLCVIRPYAINPNYLSSIFNSSFFDGFIKEENNGSSQPNLSAQSLLGFKCPFPPTLAEQERIAGALSSIDTLIGALNEQIEKKRHIKQGTMQQLLTGKKRLAGFTGEWKEVRLGELGYVIRGVGFKPEQVSVIYKKGYICLLRSNNVDKACINYDNVIFVDSVCVNDNQIMRREDILLCAANGSRNLVGKAGRKIDDKLNTFGAFMCVFRCEDIKSAPYVSFLLQSSSYLKQLDEILAGSAINNLNAKQFGNMSFSIPPTIAEQSAIAAVLSRMDTEIAALEQKRDKYIAIKSGMMQNLLTGKIRLV